MNHRLRSVLVGVVLVAVLVGSVLLIKKYKPAPAAKPKGITGLISRGPLKALGPANASVKLTEYSDFQCPSCRGAQIELHKILAQHPGKVQLVFKHFPLSSHQWSIYAHQAAECMNRQGKFWPYQDKLYEKQGDWSVSKEPPVGFFMQYAKELGANTDQLMACMADVTVTRSIYEEKEEGNQRQVNATPTLFFGEARYVGPMEMKERAEKDIQRVLEGGAMPTATPVAKPHDHGTKEKK